MAAHLITELPDGHRLYYDSACRGLAVTCNYLPSCINFAVLHSIIADYEHLPATEFRRKYSDILGRAEDSVPSGAEATGRGAGEQLTLPEVPPDGELFNPQALNWARMRLRPSEVRFPSTDGERERSLRRPGLFRFREDSERIQRHAEEYPRRDDNTGRGDEV